MLAVWHSQCPFNCSAVPVQCPQSIWLHVICLYYPSSHPKSRTMKILRLVTVWCIYACHPQGLDVSGALPHLQFLLEGCIQWPPDQMDLSSKWCLHGEVTSGLCFIISWKISILNNLAFLPLSQLLLSNIIFHKILI